MSEFRMPSLGSDMEAGTLVEQSLAPGDTVHRGDVIGAVETQKGVIEIEVFEDGILDEWLVDLGTTVPVGTPLAVIRQEGAPASEGHELAPPPTPTETERDAPENPASTPEKSPSSTTVKTSTPKTGSPPQETASNAPPSSERLRITPAARRLATERGMDITTLRGKGNDVITRRDIEALQPPEQRPSATDFRMAIAAAMSRSKKEIPHYYLSHEVDLTAADAFVKAQNADRTPAKRLLIGAVCAKAIANALARFPECNGHYIDDEFRPSKAVHLGFAINIRAGGLVAPALFDAETLGLDDLMQAMRDLTARVRAGRLRARELSEATATLTSLGERGTDAVFGVIYPPQVAIVGMGAPRVRPAIAEDTVLPRLMTTVTLAADHRVSDGARGALLLRAIEAHLQKPETL